MWWNAAAKSRVLRLEALPRSLPLGSQSCLFCVSRTHPLQDGTVLVSDRVAAVRRFGLPRGAGSGGDAESGGSLRSVGEIGAQCAVDQVRQPSFEAAEGFAAGFAFGSFALVVGAAFGVCADLGDRYRVERPVELPVPAAVQAVSYGAPEEAGMGAVPLAVSKWCRVA